MLPAFYKSGIRICNKSFPIRHTYNTVSPSRKSHVPEIQKNINLNIVTTTKNYYFFRHTTSRGNQAESTNALTTKETSEKINLKQA